MQPTERHDDADFLPDHYPVIPFQDDAWQWFRNACADLEIPVDDAKKAILERIYSHLLGVNEWLNLTRILGQLDYLKFHVFDSLTVLNLAQTYTEEGSVCLDLGSGGGYPGLPLMTWMPDRRWYLVDSRAKKVQFLKQALKLTGCRHAEARAFRGREAHTAAPDIAGKCQLVTARAVGRANELLPDADALLAPNGIFLLLKGQSYPTEERDDYLAALPNYGFTLMEEHNIALDEGDPDRWVVLALKTGDGPASTTSRRPAKHHWNTSPKRKR